MDLAEREPVADGGDATLVAVFDDVRGVAQGAVPELADGTS